MKLSVIVCTFNRSHAIISCLDSIAKSIAMAPPIEAEIVVVDNASTDDTSAIVAAWAGTSPTPLRLIYEGRKGLSAARNCGIGAAHGELLIFTDDDCRLSPTYIQEALAYDAEDVGPVLRGGSVKLGDPTDLPLTIKDFPRRVRWSKALKSAHHENLGNCLLGCNMMMRKTTALLIGPFDENLGVGSSIPGGEDTDYIFRAYLKNVAIEGAPDLAVYHFHGRKKIADGTKLFVNYTLGSGALYAKYMFKDPNLCKQLYWDLKNALKEWIQGGNNFMPDVKFSNRDKLHYSIVGALKYLFTGAGKKQPARTTPPAADHGTMHKLSAKLDMCAKLIVGKAVYLDYPTHRNIGDLLIWAGTLKFLQRNNIQLIGQFGSSYLGPHVRSAIDQCSTICFHGGGNFGDIWPWYQKLREIIIQEHPDKRIIIFPQSVHFNNTAEFDKCCAILKGHKDLHIFLRDKKSFVLLEERRVPNLYLCPDMAHALWDPDLAQPPVDSTPLYLLRRDCEMKNPSQDPTAIVPQSVDWEDLAKDWVDILVSFGIRFEQYDSRRGNYRLYSTRLWLAIARLLIQRGIDLMMPHETIVTDRLHGVILAALLQRKVVAYDNSYGKVSSYIDCWMSDMPTITQKGT